MIAMKKKPTAEEVARYQALDGQPVKLVPTTVKGPVAGKDGKPEWKTIGASLWMVEDGTFVAARMENGEMVAATADGEQVCWWMEQTPAEKPYAEYPELTPQELANLAEGHRIALKHSPDSVSTGFMEMPTLVPRPAGKSVEREVRRRRRPR